MYILNKYYIRQLQLQLSLRLTIIIKIKKSSSFIVTYYLSGHFTFYMMSPK
jgi:hypothetical protein